ncbi:hypothetical protein Bpfe_028291, partial [Biomphalaria pfeifferi]
MSYPYVIAILKTDPHSHVLMECQFADAMLRSYPTGGGKKLEEPRETSSDKATKGSKSK